MLDPERPIREADVGSAYHTCREPSRLDRLFSVVCTENLIRVDDVMELPKLAE